MDPSTTEHRAEHSQAEDQPAVVQDDLRMLAYEISLGAVAGGFAGVLVGGLGGRLAMLLLRLTSGGHLHGLDSDDGFAIGQFSLASFNLLATTAAMGSIVGLIMVAGRPFFPERRMPIAWMISGALCGGALFIRPGGVDFTVLSPRWLAVTLFILLPAAFAFTSASLIEVWRSWWGKDRVRTTVVSVTAIPAIVFIPIGIATLFVGGLWFGALRFARFRGLHRWMPARRLALAVLTGISVLFGLELAGKLIQIL